ncbi:cytochrome aa3 quinol oxidase subunit II, partial [Staphylococcus aureus]
VLDKPLLPARNAQITNANYKRHGMKLMILGNDETYKIKFKKDESKNAKEMKKISKDAQDQDNDDQGGGP